MGTNVRFLRKFSLGLLASVLTISPVHAQDAARISQLETRVGKIETKLDAVIELLAKDNAQSGETAHSATSTPSAMAVEPPAMEGLQQGLSLDLYLVGNEETLSEIPVDSGINPSASETISPSGTFEWGAFTKLKSMERFTGPLEKQVALNWKGKIAIPAGGNHAFDLSVTVDRQSRTRGCIGSLFIDDQPVVEVVSRASSYNPARAANNQGSVALEEGYHNFSFWGHCYGNEPRFERVHFTLLNKGPDDRAPKPIAANRFATDG